MLINQDLEKILTEIKITRTLSKVEKEKKTKVPLVSYKAKFVINFNHKFFTVLFKKIL